MKWGRGTVSTYRRYQDARDTAWRALLQLERKRLPVDAEALARQAGVEIHAFPGKGEERLRRLVLMAGDGPCVSLRIRGQWHIFLREDRLDDSRRRFSVAHELGHLFLGHATRRLAPGVRAFESRDNPGDLLEDPESLEDYAADIFAIRLLAPACLLHEMRVDQAGNIRTLCGLPPRAAALRAERMALLNQRDAFYNHPLERQVRDQFLSYLRGRALPLEVPRAEPARAALLSPPRPAAVDQRENDAGRESVRAAPPDASDSAAAPRCAPPPAPDMPAAPPPPPARRAEWKRFLPALLTALVLGAVFFLLFQKT